MRPIGAVLGLALVASACSAGDGGTTTSTSLAATTTTTTVTTTTVATTTTTIPPTTTTTIDYNTAEDLQRHEEVFWEAFNDCQSLIRPAVEEFNPLIENPEAAQLISECKGRIALPSTDLTFDSDRLTELSSGLAVLIVGLDTYVNSAVRVLATGSPKELLLLNQAIENLNANLQDWHGVDESTTFLSEIPLAPLPKPPSFRVNVGFDRGHEAVVSPNWFGSDDADLHFTDSLWCAGHGYRVIAEDGTELRATCPEELEAEADPTKVARGDDWYYVGDEIAAGTWRSRGAGDDCYWAVYDIDGDIMDNHFGPSTTTMRIRSGAYQVEIDGCGVWLFG